MSATKKAAEALTKGERTRRRIVEQSAPIFNQHGYQGSSLSALMQATGLRKGGIYRHFSSKEELAAKAFDYAWESVRRARLLHLGETPGEIAKLRQLISNFIEVRSPVPGGCPILNTATESDDGNPVLREHVRTALRSWLAMIRLIVQRGIKCGEIRRDVDPKTVATTIVAALEGGLMISRLEKNDKALRRIQGHLNRYLDKEVAQPEIAKEPAARTSKA